MRVFSGPMPASESAASTFTLAGNARHASVAGPSKISVSVVIRSRSIFCCAIHGAPARLRGGLRVSIVTDVTAPTRAPLTPLRPAIAGLDGVKGARVGAVTSVTMETRKPPRSLAGAPWIAQQKIDLDRITTETLIFEGPATEACRAFPANVNVLAALSLAGIGPEKTRIKLYAVPGQRMNMHRITVEGEFGRLAIEVENVPSENPRTGKLSYLSTIALLRELVAPLRVGT